MRPSRGEGDFFPLGGREIPTGMSRRLGVKPHPGRGKRYPGCAQLHPSPLLHPLCPLHPVPQQSHSPPLWGQWCFSLHLLCLETPHRPPASSCPPQDAQHPRDQPLPQWELGHFPPSDGVKLHRGWWQRWLQPPQRGRSIPPHLPAIQRTPRGASG